MGLKRLSGDYEAGQANRTVVGQIWGKERVHFETERGGVACFHRVKKEYI